jgi:DNA-binding Xre family transcriptional regulator
MLQEILTKPSLNTLFANARMTNRPLTIVEGVDDIQFYDRLSLKIQKKFKIVAIENINSYSEGCRQVLKATIDFQEKLHDEEINLRYFLAIIDKDVTDFRNQSINMPGLFTLKYYSYETHFLTAYNLSSTIKFITAVTDDLLDQQLIVEIDENLKSELLSQLFYFSLEALKNSIDPYYNALIGYKTIPNTDDKVTVELLLNNTELIQKLELKKSELDIFANGLQIESTYENLKKICKGKWLLVAYSKALNKRIKSLKEDCKSQAIQQCQFCSNSTYEKCLYKTKVTYQDSQLKEIIQYKIDIVEVDYILDRMRFLN